MELPHLLDDVLESAFLKGLKQNLRDQVVRCRPINMNNIVEIARLIKALENDNTSYQFRSFAWTNHPQTSGFGQGGMRGGDYSQAKKPYKGDKDQRKPILWNHNPYRSYGDKWFLGHAVNHLS